jgi:hypothetical protein
VLDKAIAEFNRQMSQHGLNLTLSKVEKGMGPHIVLETEPGNGLHGSAPSQTKILNGVHYLDLVTIRVPATPRTNPNDPKSPEVGPGVRLCLLVHELIHAVGLSNAEHSPDDVFAGKAVVIPKGQYLRSGKQAADDLVRPPDGSAPMPPIRGSAPRRSATSRRPGPAGKRSSRPCEAGGAVILSSAPCRIAVRFLVLEENASERRPL